MGGGQTLAISIPHLDKFAYIGVFSSGIGLGGGGRRGGDGGHGGHTALDLCGAARGIADLAGSVPQGGRLILDVDAPGGDCQVLRF